MLRGSSARFLGSWMVGLDSVLIVSWIVHGCARILMGFVWKVFIDDH
jgi:hypothetical protein